LAGSTKTEVRQVPDDGGGVMRFGIHGWNGSVDPNSHVTKQCV
jgi:hypothetical protein